MGRGRKKAKQTRVARELKYDAHDLDLDALTKELHTQAQETKGVNGRYSSEYQDVLGDEQTSR
jgi:hypothetical protein